ncbi:MAG TPA: SUMF1/EgtB/PvdO family nonheme iron enzyme [Candidatus Paceibacterota bacterium]|nr:SUMF1/EgtB/PvdO family nonheme iron enzyme [Verrucomicrobiota bacterium]HRZ45704.1 SUMF1/EgtB/PvdO family nonheme iron enzyme [Candidatus Paceibacterota bacterium]HRZ94101.1 SUMF1/EgtB/PvdO family nonheme iron enzyme [Candidatus Paceibacterota bacterium]
MIRGGSWNNNPQNCRSANRNNNNPDNRNNNIGFRVVLAQIKAGWHKELNRPPSCPPVFSRLAANRR